MDSSLICKPLNSFSTIYAAYSLRLERLISLVVTTFIIREKHSSLVFIFLLVCLYLLVLPRFTLLLHDILADSLPSLLRSVPC